MSELRLDFDTLPAPVALSVAKSPLGEVRVSIGLGRADDVATYASAFHAEMTTVERGHGAGLRLRSNSMTAKSPGLVVHVVGAQVESDDDPEADPDLSAASAAWHAEHPGERCPNAPWCPSCSPKAVA